MYSGILGCNSINLLILKKNLYKKVNLKFDNKVMLVNILNDEKNILIMYMIVLYIELLFILVFEMGRLIKDFVCFLGKIELIFEVR